MNDPLLAERPAVVPGRNAPCWCGSGLKYKKCHLAGDRRAKAAARPRRKSGIRLKTPEEIEGIRRAGQLTKKILDDVGEFVVPGAVTGDIDRWIYQITQDHKAIPATLGYKGYPKSCCISINEVVCHGIPGERRLEEGDIANIDVTSVVQGYFGDSSRMYPVGEVSPEAQRLVDTAKECLDAGIATIHPGSHLGDIGAAIQQLAEGRGYSVVQAFGGHGTGVSFHEDPFVPHYGQPGTGVELTAGMVFTVEPMINAGGYRVKVLADDWTAVTVDGSLSAQWEHTLVVTDDGVDLLTG
ncbi:MAG: type I methionyl aminopeptidase [Acidobacteriota bacterium]